MLPPEDKAERAIIIGFGRVGRLVADMLERHKISYLAVDADSHGVARWRRDSRPVYWGDATDLAFLERCGLAEARALVVTIDNPRKVEMVVTRAREFVPDIVIVARSRDADHARTLYALGVTDAVPETIEASLQLSEAALAGLGIAAEPVIASIHERRDEFRRELQNAAAVRRVRCSPSEEGWSPDGSALTDLQAGGTIVAGKAAHPAHVRPRRSACRASDPARARRSRHNAPARLEHHGCRIHRRQRRRRPRQR